MANMLHRKAVRTLLITAVILQCQILMEVNAYSQVSVGGSGNEEGPKIYKALNLDLIFPKSFNSSDNVISTTPSATRPPEMGSGPDITDVVDVDDGRQKQQQQQQQYNPWPQSNEQTNRDAGDDDIVVDDGGDKQPLYVTPTTPNEAALYRAHNTDVQTNGIAQVVTENPINIQQQQPQRQHQRQQQQQLDDNSNNNNAAQQQQQNIATGRAVDYRTGYPFGQLITPLIKNAPRPAYDSQAKPQIGARRPSVSNVGKIVMYPPQAAYRQKPPSQAEIDKFRGKGYINDRFTPSEAVASHQLKANHNHDHNHNHHNHNHAPTYTAAGKVPASSNVVNSYVAPKNLYSFPPNNVVYPLPGQDSKLASPTSVVNSYSPPASGLLKDANYPLATASSNDDGYKYSGPLNLGYLPSTNGNDNGDNTKDQGDMGDGNGNGNGDDNGGGGGEADDGDVNDSIGVLPASAMDANGSSNNMDSMDSMDMKDEHPHDDHSYDTEKEYPTPPPEWLKSHPEAAHEHPPHDHDHHHEEEHHHPDVEFDHDHEHHHHDHEHEHHHHPDIILDHDHDSYPFHHSFPSFPVYPHYPEIIYDDHHHDHHEHHVEPPPPPTTEAPPPEPPPEPRVKKYSYFYIGRKLWYIPLYFTVWFSFYVLWLILKSIARHKVNLPNHYVARRSVDEYNLSRKQREIINQLTVSVMDKIDKFKRKYAT